VQRLSTWLIALLAIAVFAAAGYVIEKKDPVPDAGQVLPLPSVSATSTTRTADTTASGSGTSSPGGVIAFLGDDWTTGSGASAKSKRFSTLLAKQLGLTERNFGADGTGYAKATATDGTYDSRVDAVVKAKPRVVVVSGGRNDVADYLQTTKRHIHDLFSTLHDNLPDAVVIAVEPFWGDSDKPAELGPIASAVKSEVTADGGHYLALGDPIHNHPSFMADASDPNDKGNAAIAKAMAGPVQALVNG
jgi:lysophospholipase L1-like esterase